MDWRTNPWVGVGAVVLIIVGVIGVMWFRGRGSDVGQRTWRTFKCQSTGEMFHITIAEAEDKDTFMTYSGHSAEDLPCRICGGNDAREIYYCPTCDKWYQFKSQAEADAIVLSCPLGHIITE